MTLYAVFYAADIFLKIIRDAILIYCILSWFRPRFRAFDYLGAFIRPFVQPFRSLSMRLMRFFSAPVDFTCLLALLALSLGERVWWWIYSLLTRVIY